MKKYLFLSVAAIALLSCTKELNRAEQVAEEPAEPVEVVESSMPDVFYATVDEKTKAGFTYDSVNKEYNHFWNVNDKIFLYHESTRATYNCTNAATGEFSKVADSETAVSYSFTNYCAVYDNIGTNPVNIQSVPAANKVTAGFSDSYTSATDGYANIMVASSDDPSSFTFTSLVGWLKLKLKGSKSVSRIQVYGNGNELSYAYPTITFKADNSHSVDWSFQDNGNYVDFSTPVALNESTATDFYMPFPPMTFSSGIQVVINYSEGDKTILNTANAVAITANKVTPMATLNIVKNLGATETANCYIVTRCNYYKFPVVQGNSSTSVGSVDHVGVLWETKNDFSSAPSTGQIISNVAYADGFVSFYTPNGNPGNALIAAYNSSDEILWSWHIWKVADDQVPHSVTYTNTAGGTFLDRNIGALSATKTDGSLTWGLYYQWGRKDPFLGGTSGSSGYKATSYSPSSSELFKKTMEYRVQNPTVYIYETMGNDSSPDNCTWGYEADGSQNLTPVKSIYDPCPPGYAVSTGATNGNHMTTQQYWYIATPSYDSTNSGYEIATTSGTNWYPCAGFVTYNGSYITGAYGKYHTTAYNSTWFYFDSDSYTAWGSAAMSPRVATPIRCQKL